MQSAAPSASAQGAKKAAKQADSLRTRKVAKHADSTCAPIAAEQGATIAFGREGGNLRPASFTITADGRITQSAGAGTRDSIPAATPAAVAALARVARTGRFWMLAPRAIRRPARNPDAAREFIEVTLACGSHRVEYVAGTAPAVFSELLALLEAVVR